MNSYIAFFILALVVSCAEAPQRLDLTNSKKADDSTDGTDSTDSGDSSVGDDSSDSDTSQTTEDTSQGDTSTDTLDESYAFDAAFPVAAALASTSPKVVRTDNQPLGWGETNQYTALFDYMRTSGSTEYKYMIDLIYTKNVNMGEKNFINEFFDDTAWWALAWIVAYDITKEKKYLESAKTIAEYIYKEGWSTKCGGGVIWKRGGTDKNAIASGLFLKLTASLHNRIEGDTRYLSIAEKDWEWFVNSDLVGKSGDDNGIVADAIGASDCKRSGAPFSYNQGQILGASVELYLATKNQKYLDKAKVLSEASRKLFSNDKGILYEKYRAGSYDCGPGKDNIYFKGAYARNLREINGSLNDDTISQYLMKSSKFAWDTRKEYDAISGCFESESRGELDSSYLAPTLDIINGSIMKKRANVAIGKSVSTSLASCTEKEGSKNIVDGDASTKWCSKASSGHVDIDLGSEQVVHRVRILHSGAGALLGDVKENNTKDFELLLSSSKDGPWTSVAKVTKNTSSGTSTLVNAKGRYLRLNITDPGSDGIIRIYDVLVD